MYLGIDMSTSSSGYALFDNDVKLIDYGRWISDKEMEWRDRILWMAEQLSNFIDTHNIKEIYCEDVPLIMNNPQTLKMLSALQGSIMGVCSAKNVSVEFISVTKWRSALGLFNGTTKGKERDEMKRSSIELANNNFGLELIYKSPSSKFNEDDIADAINVAYSKIRTKKMFKR